MKDLTPVAWEERRVAGRIVFLEPPLPEEQVELRQKNAGSSHPGSCPCRAAMTERMGMDRDGEMGQDITKKGHIWESEGLRSSPLLSLVMCVGGWVCGVSNGPNQNPAPPP